jgi:V8-like Glu-specific endopeptidase
MGSLDDVYPYDRSVSDPIYAVVKLTASNVCTAIAIPPRLLLTANHCVTGLIGSSSIAVSPGATTVEIGPSGNLQAFRSGVSGGCGGPSPPTT